MPADNITRAIKKGTGELEGTTYEDLVIEGYGPGGVALLIEGSTDNRNRTISEIRHLFSKYNGNLGNPGSVAYMFHPRGVISIAADKTTEDKLMEIVLEAGAEDIATEEEGFTVYTAPADFEAVREAVVKEGIEPDDAEVKKIADNNTALEGSKAQAMLKLLDALEDHEDVQNVWENSEISAQDLEAASAG
jgi:YebC/PmpR family DNA-binding regulatory protein